MEIIAETGSGINTPLYDSIALHIVAVRRIFSDDPGHRPPAGQEKAILRRLALSLRNILFAPKVLLRAAPLSSFNSLPQSTIFFAPSQRFFHILFILVEDEQKCTVVPRFFDEITTRFQPATVFSSTASRLFIDQASSLSFRRQQKAASSRLGESRFLFTCWRRYRQS